jgi:DNA-binding beta-propeller fold protein YncE
MKLKIFSLIILGTIGVNSFSQTLAKVWTASEGLKTPESVLYDTKTNQIYVSNINGQPSVKDGNGFISVLSPDGKVIQSEWVTGLNAPKGQAVYNGKLYVSDIDELVVISIADAQIVKRYKVENAKFLNDVTASEDGIIFVTDMNDNKIYALTDDKLAVWLEDKLIEKPNGLWAEKGKLYIGTGQILEADIPTKKISILVENCGGIDGLEKLKDGNFVYSNWQGRIFITKGKESIQLLDTVDKQNSADIDFVPEKNLILVPTFFGNSIDAYRLNYE